jgi:hypothetical protein
MVGLGYIIEAVIYNFLESYQYYPKFIKSDPVYDSNMGAIASNALALPAVATFIGVLRKNWIWILSFIVLFAGIEWLFLKLEIYRHNWWRIAFTSMGLPFYFYIAKVLYRKILQPLTGLSHSVLLFLMIGPIVASLHIVPIMFLMTRIYRPGWFDNPSSDSTAFAALFYIIACLVYVAVVKLKWKYKWIKYVLIALAMWTVTIILKKMGIIQNTAWWDTPYYIIIAIINLIFTFAISKRLTSGPPVFKKDLV